MGGKAKFQKHTAKDLAMRANDGKSTGGGKAGSIERTTAKLNFTCDICKSASPDIKSFELHYGSKHPKATFNKEEMIKKAEALRESQSKAVVGSHHKK
ncbi:TPA: hypothetical protein N0F65_002112 [Lagenidium giganteum]|uniref:Zinc finger protein n=1 Tax=Lagenidium giganteum TaxID=4803 RepID=A0AAV2ZEJ7_9STRA|nr:TPA: hypothetical protein N0F65_002112 [Lagenidium giganteum]